MHVPDGFVDIPVAVAAGVFAAGVVTLSARKTGRRLGERTVPLLGVTAAFIFAAQMLNFPVAGGTSGHFLGAMLAASLMGPCAACIVMTVVLVIQAIGMADGGITALGVNVLNMGVIGAFGGFAVFYALKRIFPRGATGYFIALAAGSWLSVVLASAACSAELAASGTVPLSIALPAMTSVHMIIGIGEALITVTVVGAVLAARPDLVRTFDLGAAGFRSGPSAVLGGRARFWGFVAGALVVAVALAVFVAPFASSSPDGLERVATDKGFETAASTPVWGFSPLPDYLVPGVESEGLATALAGLAGTVVLFAVVLLVGRALSRRRRIHAATPAGGDGPPA